MSETIEEKNKIINTEGVGGAWSKNYIGAIPESEIIPPMDDGIITVSLDLEEVMNNNGMRRVEPGSKEYNDILRGLLSSFGEDEQSEIVEMLKESITDTEENGTVNTEQNGGAWSKNYIGAIPESEIIPPMDDGIITVSLNGEERVVLKINPDLLKTPEYLIISKEDVILKIPEELIVPIEDLVSIPPFEAVLDISQMTYRQFCTLYNSAKAKVQEEIPESSISQNLAFLRENWLDLSCEIIAYRQTRPGGALQLIPKSQYREPTIDDLSYDESFAAYKEFQAQGDHLALPKSDIQISTLWRNAESGVQMESISTMDSGGITKSIEISYQADGWRKIGTLINANGIDWKYKAGNLTGSDAPSVVWHAQELGALGVWTDGTDNWTGIAGWFDANWTMLGCGDFDGDGKDSVLMSLYGGLFYSVELDGTLTALGSLNWSGWEFGAVGDFAGDGKDDVVLYHKELGCVVLLADGNADAWTSLGQIDGSDWAIVGAFDSDGDGKDDLLVRQISTEMMGAYSGGDISRWSAGVNYSEIGINDQSIIHVLA
jgi:hypothetical protein